jgi:hypothetical protein
MQPDDFFLASHPVSSINICGNDVKFEIGRKMGLLLEHWRKVGQFI